MASEDLHFDSDHCHFLLEGELPNVEAALEGSQILCVLVFHMYLNSSLDFFERELPAFHAFDMPRQHVQMVMRGILQVSLHFLSLYSLLTSILGVQRAWEFLLRTQNLMAGHVLPLDELLAYALQWIGIASTVVIFNIISSFLPFAVYTCNLHKYTSIYVRWQVFPLHLGCAWV